MNQENDDDVVVANHSKQILEEISIDVSYTVYQKMDGYLFKKHPNTKLNFKDLLKENDYIFSLGIDQAEKELENLILFEEKKPRKDVMINLGKIANELLKSPTYPKIRAVTLLPTINKVMPFGDKRTKAKYLKCIQQYLEEPGELSITDVSGFIDRIPNEFLNTTSSTTSFEEIN